MALSNSQYDFILRTYEKRQLQTRDEQDKRYETVCNKIPEYRKIQGEISDLSIRQARKLLEGDQSALQTLKIQMKNLSEKAKDLLISNGFS